MTTHRGVLVDIDGTVTAAEFDAVNLDAMTSALEVRYVDCVQVRVIDPANEITLDAWVDDEGLFNSPANPVASQMVAALSERPCQEFHGRMLFVACDRTTGESIGLPAEHQEVLLAMGGFLAKMLLDRV